jgi:hypothetical protein
MSELLDIAAQVYDDHGFSEEGIACLRRRIGDSESLCQQALDAAARSALREVMRDVRDSIGNSNGEAHQPKTFSAETQEGIAKACRGFLERPLMDGTLLGQATLEQVLSDHDRYKAYAEGNAREARFLALVAKPLVQGQQVSEVWDEAKLKKAYARSAAERPARRKTVA